MESKENHLQDILAKHFPQEGETKKDILKEIYDVLNSWAAKKLGREGVSSHLKGNRQMNLTLSCFPLDRINWELTESKGISTFFALLLITVTDNRSLQRFLPCCHR